MSFVQKIKSLMPVSSRSFHNFEKHVNSELNQIRRVSTTGNPKNDIRFWALFQREGESLLEAKQRFFEMMPPATGEMRLLQKAQAKLLSEFDKVCAANGIRYLATGGTLIGAERHKGFIPWDDDLDVAIPRNDLMKLSEVLSSSTKHRIAIVWDYGGACEQIRFRTKDPNNPAFVDLFIFDWTSEPTVEMYRTSQRYRKQLKEDIIRQFGTSEWATKRRLPDSASLATSIRELFGKYRLKEQQERYVSDEEHAQGLYRSIENFDDPTKYPYVGELSDWFPAQQGTFEGAMIPVPNNKEKYLTGPYGDIWELPDDIDSHFQHISRRLLEDENVLNAISLFLAE